MNTNEPTTANELLIAQVIERIKTDLDYCDTTAIAELLAYVPEQYLRGYLPEALNQPEE